MVSVAGPSNGGSANPPAALNNMTRATSRTKTNKRIDQERILHHLLAAFLQDGQAPSPPSPPQSRSAQKAKALQIIDKDSWSPADDDEVAAAVQGLALKHTIHLDHELALALRRCYSELLSSCDRAVRLTEQARDAQKRRGLDFRTVQDPLIRPDNVSAAVRLLLQLSKPADVTTRTAANLMLTTSESGRAQYLTAEQRKQAQKREWLSILVDEPLQGDAWADEVSDQNSSDLSDWSLDSEDEHQRQIEEGYDSDKEIRRRKSRLIAVSASIQPSASSVAEFAERELWTHQRQSRLRALTDTLKGSIATTLHPDRTELTQLTEADAVRESLSALMGYSTPLFTRTSTFKVTVNLQLCAEHPVLAGLSDQLQEIVALIDTFATLRSFANETISQSISAVDALTRTPAVEAFAEELLSLLERLDLRLSELDADISVASMPAQAATCAIRAHRYATLTQLLEFVHRQAASLLVLSKLLQDLGFNARPDTNADAGTVGGQGILDDRVLIDGLQALLGFVHQQDGMAYSEAVVTDLSKCLLAACRPAWASVCRLIQRGLSFAVTRDHDPLFEDRLVQHLIKHDALLPTSDSTFWTSGYVARLISSDAGSEEGVDERYSPPGFLQCILEDVLTTAKGVGLLRSLGIDALGEVQPNTNLDLILGFADTGSLGIAVPSQRRADGDVDRDHAGAGSHADIDAHALEDITRPRSLTPQEAQNKVQQLLFPRNLQDAQDKEKRRSKSTLEAWPTTPLSQPETESFWHVGTSDRPQRASNRLLEPVLGRSLQEHLSPISAIVRKRLIEVLTAPTAEGGYALQTHLKACHGLFFMQRGVEMSEWAASLFTELDRRNGTVRAIEPYRLNSGFSDAVETLQRKTAAEPWIDTNLVRFMTGDEDLESVTAVRQRSRLRRLADVQVEYDVPWPLTFVFPLRCMRFYQISFTTLLQARYAQWKLSNTLKAAQPGTVHMRKFWALRRQAQWLVRTLFEFLQTDVLLDGSQRLCAELDGIVSLDCAIQTHIEALGIMEMLCFHRVDQAKVKELFMAAWRLGVEVVNNYERFIGTSSRDEDRLARRKQRERRKKRRDKAKRDGAPLGVIAEADEEEEEDEEDEDEEEEEEEKEEDVVLDGGPFRRSIAWEMDGEVDPEPTLDLQNSTWVDASMSADVSASWMESETHKRERFRIECERQRRALYRLVEELKISIDEQIGRIAGQAATRAQDATRADQALQEHDYLREKWQGLLYALAWSDLTY